MERKFGVKDEEIKADQLELDREINNKQTLL